jgi:hypothetical protein
MKNKRVVESVALLAALPFAGIVACGAEGGGTGSEPGPAPAPTQYQPIQVPGPTGTNPPIIGSGPPIGTSTTNPTTPPPGGTTTPPPGGTTTPPPGGTTTTPIPTTTVPPPGGTTPPPGGTTTAPVPTTTTPVPTVPPPAYDANGILLPPDPSLGIQIATPTFTLQPGSEQFKCYHTSILSSTETDVHRWVSQMTPGSHHFILYAGGTAPDGQMDNNGCAGGLSNQWVYASSVPNNQMPMPDGVAMPMAPNQKINFDMHYINTGSTPLEVHILLNVEKIQTTNFQRAGALVSFNTSINVPPMGDQTVSGSCSTPAGANFFILSTHTHKHATLASIHDGSATGPELVHTTDWENPDTKVWLQAPFYNFTGKLYYSCTYHNDTTTAITVGTSAIRNEMCMAVTYFFPAPNGSQACSPF